MKVKFATLIVTLIRYNVVFCLPYTGNIHELFHEVTDRFQIEQAVAAHIDNRGSIATQAGQLAPLQSVQNICSSSRNVKIAFCTEILELDYHGFEFDSRVFYDDCSNTNFWVTYPTIPNRRDEYPYETYICPAIHYNDLVTGRRILLTYLFYVSKAEENDSAFLFVKQMRSPAYTQAYAQQISFDKLATRRQQRSRIVDRRIPILAQEAVYVRIMRYIQAQRISKPYEKFKELFSSFNVCAFRRSHRLYLCLKNLPDYFQQEGHPTDQYDEEKCKKRPITVRFGKKDDTPRISRISLIQCPPGITKNFSNDETDLTLYYISSNTEAQSLTIFSRINKKGENITARGYVDYFSNILLLQDVRREQFMLYSLIDRRIPAKALLKPYERIENEIQSVTGDVRMPWTIKRSGDQAKYSEVSKRLSMINLKRDKLIVDDLLISFSRIKKSKLVYRRFREMHKSLDICPLSSVQKQELCNDILSEGGYYFQTSPSLQESDHLCVRQKVALTTRDVDDLYTDAFTMWVCPSNRKRMGELFLVGKSHLRDVAFVFRAFDLQPITVYPYGYATHINRQYLAADYFVNERKEIYGGY